MLPKAIERPRRETPNAIIPVVCVPLGDQTDAIPATHISQPSPSVSLLPLLALASKEIREHPAALFGQDPGDHFDLVIQACVTK